MQKKLSFFVLIMVMTLLSFGQQGYSYHIRINGLKDTTLMLGHHYGSKQYVIDTVRIDSKGEAVFSGADSLPGGIYLVVAPALKNRYFEMIVTSQERSFSMETDTTDFVAHMQVKGSAENEIFYRDIRFINEKKAQLNVLKAELDATPDTSAQAKAIREKMRALNNEVESTRAALMTEHPGKFYPKFLHAVTDIHIPDAPVLPDGNIDSLFPLRYIREHFFDNIDFTDERLLRTNMYDTRIHKYIKDYIDKSPDSIMVAVDLILSKALVNNKTFQYITVMLLNEYATSKIMGYDAVYVYIVDKYYSTGKAFWLDDVGLYRIQAQAESVRPTLLGKVAQPLLLQDVQGQDIPLYGVQSRFTIVLFWSPTCSHCKKEMPKVETLYPEIKALGGEIYAAYNEVEFDKWEQWLAEHPYPWINVADKTGKEMMEVKYHVDMTPLIFVLDRNKKIIAKKLSIEQVPGFLKDYIKIEELRQ